MVEKHCTLIGGNVYGEDAEFRISACSIRDPRSVIGGQLAAGVAAFFGARDSRGFICRVFEEADGQGESVGGEMEAEAGRCRG